MNIRHPIAAMLALLGAGCLDVDVASVNLQLRQPVNRDLLKDADRLSLRAFVDGRDEGVELAADGELTHQIPIRRSTEDDSTESHELRFEVSTVERGSVSGFGRSASYTVPAARLVQAGEAEAQVLKVPVLLGVPGEVVAVVASLPSARSAPAVCASAAGATHILSGTTTDGVVDNGYRFDPDVLAIRDNSRVDLNVEVSACVVVGDAVFAARGCTQFDEDDPASLVRLVGSGSSQVATLASSCGRRLVKLPGAGFAVGSRGEIVFFNDDGDVQGTTPVPSSHATELAALSDGSVAVARGFDVVGEPVTDALQVHADGTVVAFDDLVGAFLTNDEKGQAYAIFVSSDSLALARIEVTADGPTLVRLRSVEVPGLNADRLLQSPVIFGEERVALLMSHANQTKLFVEGDGVVETTRDRVALTANATLLLTGGGEPGVDAFVPSTL